MEEKLIIRLSNNIGNQMFMFAAGYATSKLLKRKFYFDNLSSYKSRKNIYTYALDGFEIPGNIFSSKDNFTNISGYLRRKIKKKMIHFSQKSFILKNIKIKRQNLTQLIQISLIKILCIWKGI